MGAGSPVYTGLAPDWNTAPVTTYARPTTAENPQPARPQTGASAVDAVFFGIFHGLEVQRFVPGQRLVEADLAAQFGVGRNAVREAMQRLAADGIVDVQRHKGATIKTLTLQETMHVLDVAERIAGLLAHTAAQGVGSGHSPAPLQAALQALDQAQQELDDDAFARARRNFYRSLLDAAGSRELRRLFPSIQMPIVYAQYRLPALQKMRLADYRAMGQAVIAGDAAAADAAAMAHVRHVREAIVRTAQQRA